MKIGELDTPALLVDLDRVEDNLRKWQSFCDRQGIRNRPHIKTHKIPALARLQVEMGAVGITCQKLGEAEMMANEGLKDIFLSYNIVGDAKLERLGELHRTIRICTTTDSKEVTDDLEAMARRVGKPLEIMVECDTGMHRIGVQTPSEAVTLAEDILSRDALQFNGFSTYPITPDAVSFMKEAKEICASKGIAIREVSGGGTPGMWKLPEYEGFSEYRVGTYIYNDRIIVAEGAASIENCAATVLVSVVSTAGGSWITVDGGTKTFSSDQYGQKGFGVLPQHPGAILARCSEEHGVLEMEDGKKPPFRLGEKLRILPNHACIVSNLHERAFGVRGDEVIAEWKISARGKIQ